jgi:hypothetical protein
VGRRPGTLITFPSPNGTAIRNIVTFILESGEVKLLAISNESFHSLEAAGTWSDMPGTTANIDPAARYDFAPFFENLYAANGTSRIVRLDFEALSSFQIANSPRCRFVTSFADRVIAANIIPFTGTPRPNQVQWPVNGDPTDWTGTGSGLADLSASAIGDSITGIFGFEQEAIILRRESIVAMRRQGFALPSASTPSCRGKGVTCPSLRFKSLVGLSTQTSALVTCTFSKAALVLSPSQGL